MAGAAAADPLRAGAFRVGLVLIFLYFSMLHQIQAYLMKVNLHLLYFAAVPALLGVLMSGGFARSYRGRAAYYWTGYILWMMVCVPFSSWRSGSLQHVMDYLRTVIPMLFVMSGLIVTWRECKAVMSAIAFGGLVNLASSRMFQAENRFGERLGLQFSSIADSNDFAAHLLMVLPFVLWMALNGRNKLVRAVAFAGVGFGAFTILSTGSRGGFLGLLAEVSLFLLWGRVRDRIVFLIGAPLVVMLAMAFVPRYNLQRVVDIKSFNDEEVETEAEGSQKARMYLWSKGLEYTLAFPVFGVGPGQFTEYEGHHNNLVGGHGYWHETHNSFLQASSEMGIPGFLLFTAGVFSALFLLRRTFRTVRRRPDCTDMQSALMCILLGYIGFLIAISFLSFAYFFYLPAMGGFYTAVASVVNRELTIRQQTSVT